MNLAEYLQDAGSAFGAERTAVIFGQERWTYRLLFQHVGAMSAALAGRGIGKGDRVVALMGNRPQYYVGFFACARVGAIFATINLDYTPAEIAHMIGNAEPKCVIADAAGLAKLEQTIAATGLSRPPVIRVDGDEVGGGEHYSALAHASVAPDPVACRGDEGVLLCYTSGTSGMPKPILTTQAGEQWAARSFRGMWRLNANDRVLVSLPLAWVYGLGTVSMPALSAGATIVLMPKFRPDTVAAAIAEHRATVMVGVTTMYRMLVDYAADQETPPDLSSLALAMTGGERRNEAVFAKFEALAGVPVFDIYACSEARPILGYDPVVEKRPRGGAAGKLFPGVEGELRGEDGSLVASGEVGELYARSPNSFKEYFREPKLTAERRDEAGWVRTGDLFRVDEEGYWYIQGRKSADMINRSGAKVSPAEVEAHIAMHPLIKDVVVIGRPDTRYGEEVVACVIGNVDPAEALSLVREHCRDTLADYKTPTDVRVFEQFPHGATGKIDRAALGRMIAKEGSGS